ncbi:MAG: hypothetical protein M1454_00970 [Candidatus Thermoplasmatota archaeon]|nr:hypothetical protein [Candidatus Thermoplasmatota archaeon]MCL5731274.1 hypothetical protein [Candidatus Thermoplasmatota archaeon]
MKPHILILFLFLFSMVMVPLVTSTSQAAYPPVFSATISAPQQVYEGEAFTVFMNATYGFPSYTGVMYIYGYNLSGLGTSSTKYFPDSGYSMSDNLTAPMYQQTLGLVGIVWVYEGSTVLKYKTDYSIQVVQPLFLNVTISDSSQAPLHNITVNFTLNGVLVGSKEVQNLSPYSSQSASLAIPSTILRNGENTLLVTVGNPSVSVNGGSSYQTSFYYGTPPNYSWIFYVAAAVIAFMALLVFSAGKRRARPKKPKWKK